MLLYGVQVLPPAAVIECLEAMAASGICSLDRPSPLAGGTLGELSGRLALDGPGAAAPDPSDDGDGDGDLSERSDDGPLIADDPFASPRRVGARAQRLAQASGSGLLSVATAAGSFAQDKAHPQETLKEFFEVRVSHYVIHHVMH